MATDKEEMRPLPEQMLRLMSAEDRKAIGQRSATETLERGERVSERQLQGQIVNLLRLRGLEVLWHRTDKKSAATIGWPDLTFAVKRGVYLSTDPDYQSEMGGVIPCCWEVKLPQGKLSIEQEAMREKLIANGWRWRTITSVDMALEELASLGVEKI